MTGISTDRKQMLIWLVPAIFIYAAGFALAAFIDLPLNIAVYSPNSLPAIFMECFGWYPAFLPSVMLFILLGTRRGLAPKSFWQPLLCFVVVLAGFCGLYYASYGYLEKRRLLSGTDDPALWLWVAAGVLFIIILVVFLARRARATRIKLIFLGGAATVYMAANQVVVYAAKLVWARTRFDDMLAVGSFDAYTPWYLPFGNGGSSFPSGHTANAAGIFVLLILCDLFPSWARQRKLVLTACWAWIIAMAAARILIGRHFLSDTLAASAITAWLFYGLRRTKPYRVQLEKTLGRVAALKGGGGNAL